MKKNTTTKTADALLVAAMKKLPKRATCRKCGKSRTRGSFGLRVMARSAKGLPTRIARQSWCRECRAA